MERMIYIYMGRGRERGGGTQREGKRVYDFGGKISVKEATFKA